MADIQVVIPKKATGEILVFGEKKATLFDEGITWHFRNDMPAKVKRVRIEFKRKSARFFPNKPVDQHFLEKDLAKGDTIWGRTPRYKGTVHDKYSIYGLNAKGKKVIAKDPMIISSDPDRPPNQDNGDD